MSNDSVFIFKDEKKDGSYNYYLFKDFSIDKEPCISNYKEPSISNYKEPSISNYKDPCISNALNKIRRKIHAPKKIFIISNRKIPRHMAKWKSRFPAYPITINHISYKDVESKVLQIGICQIVRESKVVQCAPSNTKFKKTSGKESSHFIKASLALSDYPQICFLSLALHKEISKDYKVSSIRKIYIDTSSIMPVVQALIYYQEAFYQDTKQTFHPKIINFKSYTENKYKFNIDGSYTLISASSSGELQNKLNILENKCTTLFLAKNVEKKCLFHVDVSNEVKNKTNMVIPLTLEDFSLDYAKSEEVVIIKDKVQQLDKQKLIDRLLSEDFKGVDYSIQHKSEHEKNLLEFNNDWVANNSDLCKFKEETLDSCLLSNKENVIVGTNIDEICKEMSYKYMYISYKKFLKRPKKSSLKGKNVIVCLNQTNKEELIRISQILRDYKVFYVTYVIGILLTESIAQSKNLQKNICFNHTNRKYGFNCWLDLPLLTIQNPAPVEGKITEGFVFYNGKKSSSKLSSKQVYLMWCLVLELLRNNNSLRDNIAFYDVLSPQNFSRFNDSLLQLSILNAAKGRELDYSSNISLSKEMLNVVIDIKKSNSKVGNDFIKAIENKTICLTIKDYEKIPSKYKPEPSDEI